MFEFNRNETQEESAPSNANGQAKIKVIGVGGAGNNAVNRMIEAGIGSAEYIAVNTDAQILACNKAPVRIQIGSKHTKGLGAGAEPEIGRAAAEEDKEKLTQAIEDTDLLFITAGMGGGTGTGAAPVIAKIARDKRILTVAVVTEPFSFEGRRRMDNARRGIEELKKHVDTIIIIPNDKILEIVPKNVSFPEALRVADDVLKQGIRGIADVIVTPSLINLDFADVRTILKDKGLAHMGVGVAKGENRIVSAVRLAVNSPLLNTTIEGATGVLINITGGNDLTIDETQTAAKLVQSVVDYSANIIFGTCIDENMQDEVEVTVIATGFPFKDETRARAAQEEPRAEAPAPTPVFGTPRETRPAPAPIPTPSPAPTAVRRDKPQEIFTAPREETRFTREGTEAPHFYEPETRQPSRAAQEGEERFGGASDVICEYPYPTDREKVLQGETAAAEGSGETGDKIPPFVRLLLGKKNK